MTTPALDPVPVLVVADPHDELQGMVGPLKEAVKPLDIETRDDRALDTISSGGPLVLMLAFSHLEQSQLFYLRTLKRCPRERMDLLQTVVLCDRTEASRAFDLCSENVVDDYLVAKPLYDQHQIVLSVKQARDRIALRRWLTDLTQHRGQEKDPGRLVKDLEAAIAAQAPPNPRLQTACAALRRAILDLSTHIDHGAAFVERGRATHGRAVEGAVWSLPDSAPLLASMGRTTTILVVDDDDLYRQVLEQILTSAGFEVLLAASGPRALALLRTDTVDLVLMDIELPVMSGLEATRRIREMPSTRSVPVVMMTVHSEWERVEAALAAGASDFIVKPGTRATILEKVTAVLEGAARRGASAATFPRAGPSRGDS